MRLRPLFARPVAVSLLTFLTGNHLSRIPSPALSMATATLSAGGLLGTHLLIALGAKTEDLSIPPGPNRALKLISLHAYDADKMIMKLAYPAVGNWPESQIWRWQIGSDRVEEVRDGLPE